ncbi:hypothetical protein EUX98_g5844 [Antrodiella citrinella]|uniref:Carbonic anhydrase n=1 Tax=Antrodiella citrinella TaxID=2447956 RepID=A0A4S4MSB8_9APHY|nr:hypothetical protein EUX98_g5844 [Antrodiella citrinella]
MALSILQFLLLSLCLVTYTQAHSTESAPPRFGRFGATVTRSRREVAAALTTDPALAKLLVQNEAWAENMDETRPGFFNTSAQSQNPAVLWLGCSDSRVPESVITNSLPGDIFVERNIANQVLSTDTNILAVLTYAIEHLNVSRIVIAGHTHCGGVQYCYDQAASLPTPTPNPLPPLPDPVLNTWLSGLYTLAVRLLNNPSISTSAPQDADAAMELITVENVRMQVESTSELDVVQKAWNEGKDLRIVGWLHQLENGRLKDLGICAGPDGDVGCSL